MLALSKKKGGYAMERYDGKTRRNDYIKYTLIGVGVAVVVIGLCLLTHFLKKANQKDPDYTVVIGSEEAFNNAMVEQLEDVLAGLVGDRNGDGDEIVDVEVLRLTDYAAAKQADLDAEEGEKEFASMNMDDDFSRLLLKMTTEECYLYLLSDQPRGSFRGAATTYCEAGYFVDLPEDMQDTEYAGRMELTNAPFLEELGLEDIPFYGCVLDGGDSGERNYAIELLRKLPNAHGSVY